MSNTPMTPSHYIGCSMAISSKADLRHCIWFIFSLVVFSADESYRTSLPFRCTHQATSTLDFNLILKHAHSKDESCWLSDFQHVKYLIWNLDWYVCWGCKVDVCYVGIKDNDSTITTWLGNLGTAYARPLSALSSAACCSVCYVLLLLLVIQESNTISVSRSTFMPEYQSLRNKWRMAGHQVVQVVPYVLPFVIEIVLMTCLYLWGLAFAMQLAIACSTVHLYYSDNTLHAYLDHGIIEASTICIWHVFTPTHNISMMTIFCR